jgi:hypothetical protein
MRPRGCPQPWPLHPPTHANRCHTTVACVCQASLTSVRSGRHWKTIVFAGVSRLGEQFGLRSLLSILSFERPNPSSVCLFPSFLTRFQLTHAPILGSRTMDHPAQAACAQYPIRRPDTIPGYGCLTHRPHAVYTHSLVAGRPDTLVRITRTNGEHRYLTTQSPRLLMSPHSCRAEFPLFQQLTLESEPHLRAIVENGRVLVLRSHLPAANSPCHRDATHHPRR